MINATNRTLGKVLERQGAALPDHLHLEYETGPETWFNASGDPNYEFSFRPSEDPLDRLTPLGDGISPVVNDLFFRYGTNDAFGDTSGPLSAGVLTPAGNRVEQSETWSETHRYFKQLDFSNSTIVGARAFGRDFNNNTGPGVPDIDIIGEVYDRVLNQGRKLGIKKIGFGLIGSQVGRSAGDTASFNFTGQFAPDAKNGGVQTIESLWDAALVRTVNEYDAELHHTRSSDNFYYTVTNTDGNQKVEAADRRRAWITMAIQGSAWNAVDAQRAPNNARSSFPDDYYDIAVTARDQADNSGTKTKRVLLDNWPQAITATSVGVEPGCPDCTIVRFTGSQWTANSLVPIWLVKATVNEGGLNPGDHISARGIYVGTAETDADGNFLDDTEFPVPYWDTKGIPTEFVADYHYGNDIYEPGLDALAELQDTQQRPTRGGFVALAPLSMSPTGLFDPPASKVERYDLPPSPRVIAPPLPPPTDG